MVRMAYDELTLVVDMDWSTISINSQTQRKPNLHHIIPWSIETLPNPLNGLFESSGFEQSLVVFNTFCVSLDANAHDDEVDIQQNFPSIFENVGELKAREEFIKG